MEMTSYVFHVSGEYIGTKIKLDVELSNKMNFMQNLGSASTYAIRYNLIALFNLCAEEDDDGVSSNKPKNQNFKQKAQQEISNEEQQLDSIKQKLLPYITQYGLKDDVVKLCGISPKNWSIENVEEIKKMIKLKKEANESNN